ncbi:sulfoxide reductase heme-binding subunit YedZ [Pasteurellaceae bacterium RH1A]|nr:sulfoxide reductase heme-binding subunit YedZ [Pasteurellaceae bacterium RH1A]
MLAFLRTLVHTGCLMPLLWLASRIYLEDYSQLGADPIKGIQHFLGFTALTILLVMFLLGIVLFLLKKNQYQILRRALGLWAWFYALLHVASYFVLELGSDLPLFIGEIFSRNYLIIGLIAFAILCLMAASSLPWVKKAMGRGWFYLHKLGYLCLLLGGVHYYLSLKNTELMALVYLGLTGLVVAWEVRAMLVKR